MAPHGGMLNISLDGDIVQCDDLYYRPPVHVLGGTMARKAVFTVPSLDEMEQTDQQVILY